MFRLVGKCSRKASVVLSRGRAVYQLWVQLPRLSMQYELVEWRPSFYEPSNARHSAASLWENIRQRFGAFLGQFCCVMEHLGPLKGVVEWSIVENLMFFGISELFGTISSIHYHSETLEGLGRCSGVECCGDRDIFWYLEAFLEHFEHEHSETIVGV